MTSHRSPAEAPVPEETGIAEDPADEHAHGRGFLNQGSRYMLLDNLSRVVEPMLVLVCARLYAGGDWGFFKYYESLLLLLARAATFGMQRGVVWIHARRGGDAAFTRAFSRALSFSLYVAVGLALLAAAQQAGWLPLWASATRGAPGASWLNVACLLAALPLQTGVLLFAPTFINKRSFVSLVLTRNLAMPLFTLLPAILLAFTPMRAHGVAVPYLAGSVFAFVLAAALYRRAYAGGRGAWSWSPRVPADLLRFSLPLGATDFLMAFAYRVDVILLGRFLGMGAVEVYAVVMMIANSLRSIRQSFDGILLSVLSRGRAHLPTAVQVRHFNYAAWMVLTLQVPFVPIVLLFGEDFLGLVGPTYTKGHVALSVAVLFNATMTMGAFSDQFVAGLGRTHVIPFAQAVFFLASVGLNFLFIPLFGIPGAALASGVAYLLGGVINFGALWRFNRGSVLLREYWSPFLGGLLMLSPAIAAGLWLDLSLPWRAALLIACLIPYSLWASRRWKRFNAES